MARLQRTLAVSDAVVTGMRGSLSLFANLYERRQSLSEFQGPTHGNRPAAKTPVGCLNVESN